MLILFNLDRFSSQPRLVPGWAFLGLAVVVPTLILAGVHWRRQRAGSGATVTSRHQEILSGVEGSEIG
jgi:hypothetical protein